MSEELVAKLGPDQVLSSDHFTTTDIDGVVKLRLGEDEVGGLQPISVPGLLIKAADVAPDVTALAVKRDDKWVKWTYKEYLQGKISIFLGHSGPFCLFHEHEKIFFRLFTGHEFGFCLSS